MKEIITSGKNAQIKEISALLKQKKERDELGLFVIEGVRIVRDACIYAPKLIKTIYVSDSFDFTELERFYRESTNQSFSFSMENLFNIETVKASVFDDIAGTVSSQGILAVVKKPSYTLEGIFKGEEEGKSGCGVAETCKPHRGNTVDAITAEQKAGNTVNAMGEQKSANVGNKSERYLILEDIQDPGNLGTMIRTAEAAGIKAVIMSRNTADIFNPKVTRATMGSCFRVPFIYADNFADAVNSLKTNGIRVYGAYLRGGKNYREAEFGKRCAIMIGNEGNGLTDEAIALADERVFIPMEGKIESLNAAVAAAILMYR